MQGMKNGTEILPWRLSGGAETNHESTAQ